MTYNQEYEILLNDKTKKELEIALERIKETLYGKTPLRQEKKKECKNCSFFDYCWIE